MGIICILVFFCSSVLILRTYRLCGNEIPGPGQGWRIAGVVQSRGYSLVFRQKKWVCTLLLKTEEHKNKRVYWKIKRMLKQAWYSFVFSMLCIWDAGSIYSTFVGKNRRRCLHCKFFAWWACGWTGGSLLMHGLTDGHHLHSCVLLFLCLYSLFTSCWWRHEIPGPGQGWRAWEHSKAVQCLFVIFALLFVHFVYMDGIFGGSYKTILCKIQY